MDIRKIDLFGCEFVPTVFGKEKYKTVHGAVFTMASVLVMTGIVLLFGRDFIYKLNPKIFSKKELSPSSKVFELNNKEFSFMWVVEDNNTVPVEGERQVFYPKLMYRKWAKNEENKWVVEHLVYPKPKKCSQTSNSENEHIQNFDLDSWNCIDWDEISEKIGEPAKLGGQWDGNVVYNLRADFQTCYFDYETQKTDYSRCSSQTDISASLAEIDQYFSFNVPIINFDTTDYTKPFHTSYKYIFIKASSSLSSRKYFYFAHESIFDDRGWILESAVERNVVGLNSEKDVYSVITENNFDSDKNQSFFSLINYFEKEEIIHFRSYIKTQEFFANIGGILKLIVMVFGYLSKTVAQRMRDVEVVELLQRKFKREAVNRDVSIRNLNDYSGLSGNYSKTFFGILSNSLCFGKKGLPSEKKKEMFACIDVVNLISNFKDNQTRATNSRTKQSIGFKN